MNSLIKKFRHFRSKSQPWWTIFGAPITQEIFFRFIPYLLFLKSGNFWEIGIISSLSYGLIYYYFGWVLVVYTFFLGLIFWYLMVNFGGLVN